MTGVQSEVDMSKSQAVSKKTAKCLLKAELIYRTHLCIDDAATANGSMDGF